MEKKGKYAIKIGSLVQRYSELSKLNPHCQIQRNAFRSMALMWLNSQRNIYGVGKEEIDKQ